MQSVIEYLEAETIHKTLIITSSDCTSLDIAACLARHDFSVGVVCTSHLDDERPNYLQTLSHFQADSTRVLCVSYDVWVDIKHDIETYAFTDVTILIYNLEIPYASTCVRWMHDADSRGFKFDKKTSVIIRN